MPGDLIFGAWAPWWVVDGFLIPKMCKSAVKSKILFGGNNGSYDDLSGEISQESASKIACESSDENSSINDKASEISRYYELYHIKRNFG